MRLRFIFLATLAALCLVGPAVGQNPGGLSIEVQVRGDISSSARNGGTSSVIVGSTGGSGGRSSVTIDGDVAVTCDGGTATTQIGDPAHGGETTMGGSVNVCGSQTVVGDTHVGGDTVTAPGADVKLGGCGSTTISGDVTVADGSLDIGCVCAGRRNGHCCIQFHRSLCVVHQTPPSKHGCPPRYVFSEGLCRLYSDMTGHSVGR